MQQLDMLLFVAEKRRSKGEPRAREQTVPIAKWWGVAAKERLRSSGKTQKELATDLGIDEGRLSRAFSGETPAVEVVKRVSFALKLPLPFLIPESMDIAEKLAEQHRLLRRDAELADAIAGAPDQGFSDQPAAITYEHAVRQRPKEGRR